MLEREPATEITVDLQQRTVAAGTGPDAVQAPIEVDDYTRYRLLNGLDDIAISLQHTDEIDAYEATRPAYKPVTQPSA